MNYTELKAQIKNICENQFDDTTLAMFTQQAEQKIYNSVQIANLRKNVTGVLASGRISSRRTALLCIHTMQRPQQVHLESGLLLWLVQLELL